MLQISDLASDPDTPIVAHVMNWVQYHDTLSRFATHHWKRKPLALEASYMSTPGARSNGYFSLTKHRPFPQSTHTSHAILALLSETCDTLVDPKDPICQTQEYQDHLRALEIRIDNMKEEMESAGAQSYNPGIVAKWYHTATKMYLLRASQYPGKAPVDFSSLVDQVFDEGHFLACKSCPHFFPLLILACETRKDEHRTAILNLIDRTGRDARLRSVQGVRGAVEMIWIQQDLYDDSDLLVNYNGILSAAVGLSWNVPSFA
jgi:hypothetical protein